MTSKTVDIALIERAQRGHKESLSILSQLVRKEVFSYLYRLTLDVHLAEDLCQETIIQMLESLPKLKVSAVKSFWAWVYKTAFSRVSRQFRNQGKTRLRNRTITDSQLLKQIPDYKHSGPHHMMQKELSKAIYEAMDSIKLKYRNILALRCFQNLSYSQIALTTGGTELQARLLFFRAKRSLRHQLASRGFKKKGQLLPALSIFAALTAGTSKSAQAATIVKAASLNISAGTAVLGMATTKVGIVSMIAAAACITTGVINRDALTGGANEPAPVYRRLNNEDPNLLNLLQSPEFQRPSKVGKFFTLDGKGLLWTDRASKGPSLPNPNVAGLLIDRPKLDKRAVIIPTGCGIIFHLLNPIINGPGADLIIAGWAGPPPSVDVFGRQGKIMPLTQPTQLMDTWGRDIFGYDLAELPKDFHIDTVRVTGTHNDGPHKGFEFNEISVRVLKSE
ncbi:MAG: sigma-70 family RNA polymerase sigma factor [Phycisphaerales bacterium]|jgi:RNA polymerase sigma-70 factor (ECF subfamily)